jgi:hypothetical protein
MLAMLSARKDLCARATQKPPDPMDRRLQLRGSPDWTRTSNPLINSQMLCQLSYQGSAELAVRRSKNVTSSCH